jgi:hypothetical protein
MKPYPFCSLNHFTVPFAIRDNLLSLKFLGFYFQVATLNKWTDLLKRNLSSNGSQPLLPEDVILY